MQKLLSYLVFPGVLGGSMAAAWAAVGLDPSRHPSALLAILGAAMMVICLLVVEANHNYGKVLAIWDWLFRTRFLLDRPVGPLGLEKDGFPMGFWSHLTSPIAWEGFVAEADSPSPRVRASNRQENP